MRRRILTKALLSRVVEDRLLELYSQGRLFGTVHTCIGQELSGAVVTECLERGDTVFSTHRGHGHFLSFTDQVDGLVAEVMGRDSGVCGGRGGSQHLCHAGFFSNGVQGGIVPVAAGLAWGHKLDREDRISVAFIGDGTLGEGVVYEAFNVVSKWSLPMLVVLEDNGYAQSTSKDETLAGDIIDRASAFGLRSARGSTWAWEELHDTTSEVVDEVRRTGRPAFLLVETFRLRAHSKGDDDRDRGLVERFEAKDPLNQLIARDDPETLEILSTAKARVDKAVARAEAARYPQGAYPRSRDDPAAIDWGTVALPAGRMGAELNQTFHALMSGDPDIVFFGEDVRSPYGGAFKVSAGLSEVYPTRVHNAPISEACIVGLGTGLAMKGFRPFVEIMFGDFLGLAFDQLLNHASKFEDMYDGQVTVDLVVRTPMGGGRAYGPTHSQTLDRHFVGMPGLTVIALNHLVHPDSVYRPLIAKSHGPTVVMENKVLYGSDLEHTPPTGFETLHSNETFPTGRLRPRSRHVDVTLLGYGGVSSLLVRAAEQLFIEHDVVAQVVCPSRIYPFEVTGILPVLSEADHLVIVEEGQGFAGFGAEVLAQLAEQGRDTFASVQRIHPPASCIPASGPAEMQMLPSVEDVVVRCRGLGR